MIGNRIALVGALMLATAVGMDVSTLSAQTTVAPVHGPRLTHPPALAATTAAPALPGTPRALGCLIQPHASADVAAGAPGVLAEVRVERGDPVKKGQVLAVLDHDVEQALLGAAGARAETRAEIATAQASLDMAQKKVERFKALTRLNYGARLELDMAEGELAVAITQLQQSRDRFKVAKRDHAVAEQQLAQRFVRSPIDGVVSDRLLNPGERADGQPVVRVITLDRLRVEVIAPAERFGAIREGMIATIQPENMSQTMEAHVEQVDQFMDAASGTFRARLLLANADLAVPAGIRCTVSIDPTPVAQLDRTVATRANPAR